MKKLAIDFDGTICREQPYGDGVLYETPQPKAKEIIEKLKKNHKIIIFTTRLNPNLPGDVALKRQRIEEWLAKYEIPYDELTNNKPGAIAYIDDRAIRFTNWQDIGNYFV